MGIYETFSKRQKRLEKTGQQDVYQYDTLPDRFRGQVAHIWTTAIGQYHVPTRFDFRASLPSPSNKYWNIIHDTIARDLGRPSLGGPFEDKNVRCTNHLLNAPTLDALNIIQLSFQVIDRAIREMRSYDAETAGITQDPDDAIEELNGRFLEHSLGYQYLNGQIVCIDSQFAHEEIVKPALSLLNTAGFDGPAQEFMNAFDHYKNGRDKEAVAEALKAFESTMKAICAARKWTHSPNATAVPLIKLLCEKKLIPAKLESQFAALRTAMESGLPTVSNSMARHGQGPDPVAIPRPFVAYALHLAASNIVFLVESHKTLN
jgi:AbiJ N-terminal domain 4